jgi:GMP synthase-like glutamine amidotransferase
MGIFKRKNEKWLMYNSGTQDYPTDEILDNSRAIIIPGSRFSAYDDTEWIKIFREWIKKTYETKKHMKILGICFGHQILSQSLGGLVG